MYECNFVKHLAHGDITGWQWPARAGRGGSTLHRDASNVDPLPPAYPTPGVQQTLCSAFQ